VFALPQQQLFSFSNPKMEGMNIIHFHRKRAFSRIFLLGIFFILINFLQSDVSASLQREQETVPTAVAQQVPTIDAGFDFVKVGKQVQSAASAQSSNMNPARAYNRPQSRTAALYTPEQALRERALEEKTRQRTKVMSYEPRSQVVEKELRPVVQRQEKAPVVVLPKELIPLSESTKEGYSSQPDNQKERFLDALFLRAEAYYEKHEYESCMQTLNSIFMFDPYHVKAQRLRRKVEIKVSGSRGPSVLTRLFGNSDHRKKIGLVRKLYRKGDYQQAIELCQQVIVEDPDNSKAEYYLNKCKQAMNEAHRKAETALEKNDTILESGRAPVSVAASETIPQEAAPEIRSDVSEPELAPAPTVVSETISQEAAPQIRSEVPEKATSLPAIVSEEQGVFSKDEAQEIALRAMMDSMGQEERKEEPVQTVIPAVSPQPAVVREPTLEERADQAREALDLGDIARAQDILNQMLMQDPENRISQEVMNDISRWIQDNERGKFDKGSIGQKRKALVRKNEKLARKAYKEKKYDHARSLYEKVLSLDPENHSAGRGLNKIAKKEREGTVKQYIGTVKELHKQRRYAEAIGTINQGLAFAPDNKSLKALAKENARLLRKETPSAPAEVTAAPSVKKKKGLFSAFTQEKKPLTGNEAEVEKLLEEAKHASKTGNYSDAVSLYENVLALDRENKKASREIDRAREKMILKGRDKKKEEERRAEQEVSEKVQFYTSVAQKLHKQGKYESAKVVIQKGLLLDPDDQALKQLRKDNEIFVKGTIEQAPSSEAQKKQKEKDTLINKGIKQYLLGDYEQAIKYFNEVLAIDPADEKAKNSIAKIEQKLQRVTPSEN
jgi:tetratricopeptide (TPR) repeat protein